MTSIMGVMCRFWKCACGRGDTRSNENDNSSDDLKRINGIGIATENRLYGAGIKSYDRLAQAKPDELRKILGRYGPGADVEKWIAEAAELASGK